MNLPQWQRWIEQFAVLAASFDWTLVVLGIVVLFWLYQDVQTRCDFILKAPPEALAQVAQPTATSLPTRTLWPGPPPTLTPTATQPPTPTATRFISLTLHKIFTMRLQHKLGTG